MISNGISFVNICDFSYKGNIDISIVPFVEGLCGIINSKKRSKIRNFDLI
ncbi:MAG: hypothetical protein K0R19_2171 [Bacillota bacterium]|jgi:hypothetical protein|nr:hypothetical protein [Bacillota bacterium]